jgi:hypothetical protein
MTFLARALGYLLTFVVGTVMMGASANIIVRYEHTRSGDWPGFIITMWLFIAAYIIWGVMACMVKKINDWIP